MPKMRRPLDSAAQEGGNQMEPRSAKRSYRERNDKKDTRRVAAIQMQQPVLARAAPIAVGVVVLIAGALQLTAWKARHLACCRETPGRGRMLPGDAGTAWRHGLRLVLHCSQCCAILILILLVIGAMDLRAMAVVAAAITVEAEGTSFGGSR
jgi:predicted metal-binding membrane protein